MLLRTQPLWSLLLVGWAALLAAGASVAAGAGTDGASTRTAHAARGHHAARAAHLHHERAGAQQELRALRARIAVMNAQNSRDALERDRLTSQLRTAELSLSREREALAQTRQALAAQGAQRAALAVQRQQKALELERARSELSDEIRSAYLLERQGPLQLLLNQHSPLASARLLTYYGYFSRAGAGRIARINADVQQLDALDAQLAQQQAALDSLRERQQAQLQQLSAGREQRQRVLVSLTTRVQTRAQQLSALQSQQAALERLLEQLRQQALQRTAAPSAAATEPADLASAFGRLRGRLDWPVQGHLSAVFGQLRPSGVPWDGVLIDTARDSPVRAVAAGRVVYADWLPGLGLLMIVDHGAGYLSLYGHNDRLYRPVGASVVAGELIAAAGDTGGRPAPQLYFEIRRDGRPVDPRPWFQGRAPSP